MKVTLDTNCLISVEERDLRTAHIKQLYKYHQLGKIVLQIVGISASEKTIKGTYLQNFSQFQEWIHKLSFDDVEILKPIAVFDITFWDWGIFADDKMIDLEKRIFSILFPKIPYNLKDYCDQNGVKIDDKKFLAKWKNAKCDVLAYWSHIYHGGGIFVTYDNNFRKQSKKADLIALGATDILTADEVINRI